MQVEDGLAGAFPVQYRWPNQRSKGVFFSGQPSQYRHRPTALAGIGQAHYQFGLVDWVSTNATHTMTTGTPTTTGTQLYSSVISQITKDFLRV